MKYILIILTLWCSDTQAQKVDLRRLQTEINTAIDKLRKQQSDSIAKVRKEYQAAIVKIQKDYRDSLSTLAQIVVGEVPTGVVDGKNKVFYIGKPVPNSEAVYVNGLRKKRGVDYTPASTGRIVFAVAPPAGAVLTVDYYK